MHGTSDTATTPEEYIAELEELSDASRSGNSTT